MSSTWWFTSEDRARVPRLYSASLGSDSCHDVMCFGIRCGSCCTPSDPVGIPDCSGARRSDQLWQIPETSQSLKPGHRSLLVDVEEDLFQQVQAAARKYWGSALPSIQTILKDALRREIARMKDTLRDRAIQEDCATLDFLEERADRRRGSVSVPPNVKASNSIQEDSK